MSLRAAGILLCGVLVTGCAHRSHQLELAPACTSDAQRQFDFWLGHWDVGPPGETARAENRIELIAGGCALLESYHSESGYRGRSLNWHQPGLGWRQTWVDSTGLILQLTGGLEPDGDMVLQGELRATADGQQVLDRIRWSPQQGGTVLQTWDQSQDRGGTWQTVFSGLYRPASD